MTISLEGYRAFAVALVTDSMLEDMGFEDREQEGAEAPFDILEQMAVELNIAPSLFLGVLEDIMPDVEANVLASVQRYFFRLREAVTVAKIAERGDESSASPAQLPEEVEPLRNAEHYQALARSYRVGLAMIREIIIKSDTPYYQRLMDVLATATSTIRPLRVEEGEPDGNQMPAQERE